MAAAARANPSAPLEKREFTVPGQPRYNHRGPARWLLSHAWQHRAYVLGFVLFSILSLVLYANAQLVIGQAAQEIAQPTVPGALGRLALTILGLFLFGSVFELARSLLIELVAQRMEVSTRTELYISLLGKSQTFHDRQRAGDIMARSNDDPFQINGMMNPGILFVADIVLGFAVPLIFIGLLHWQLLLVPVVFLVAHVIAIRLYMRQLEPVAFAQRDRFGKMNAAAEETIAGVEVVKASAAEAYERRRFRRAARLFRGYSVRQGQIEGRFYSILLYGLATGAAFFHAIYLVSVEVMPWADLIAFAGLFTLLRFPTFIGVFSFTLIQLGLAAAGRILTVITEQTDLDENAAGHVGRVQGAITFEGVSFGYDDGAVLRDIAFHIPAGATVAVVGQTGSGKSTLVDLINRTYDVTAGRVLVDGIDVREWQLDSLRSQISKIEQDVFLFSRSIADNIAFGAPHADRAAIEAAAREAQAHDFIMRFADGYETEVGERGVTLSGGQRQRIALARAFLSDPRILILDDSTSAIDSATEDEIQKAIRRAQQGRTTLLITHRLSQIRWADHILLLDRGQLVASGTHDQLLRTSPAYRRMFARTMTDLPPLADAYAKEGGL
jgi:ATP-binding cassette subfamily B protein